MEIYSHDDAKVQEQFKTSTHPNMSSRNTGDSCFICSRNKITQESSAAVLEMQGIPDTNEDKLNILKVICQLLRVRWEVMTSLFSSHDANFPFCLGCLKFIIEIIFLREQLFTIETEIRDKIRHIEASVAQSIDPCVAPENGSSDDDFECKLEPPESYEECRLLFQKGVMNEYLSKQLLERKVEEMNEASCEFAVEFHPSIVQLQLQKNMFSVTKRGSEVTDDLKGSEANETQDAYTSMDAQDSFIFGNTHESFEGRSIEIMPEEAFHEEFKLDLVLTEMDPGDDMSDDSDYGSPSKKIKLQKKTGSSSKHGRAKNVEEGIEPEECFSGTSEESDDDGDESSASGSEGDSSDDEESSGDTKKASNEVLKKINAISRKNKEPKKEAPVKRGGNKINGECISLKQEPGTFKGKDGTIWTTQPPPSCRTRAYNILREDGGLVGAATNTTLTPVQLFKLTFPPAIIDTIVTHTNQYAESVTKLNETQNYRWKPVSQDEFYAYIGILLYLGLEKKRRVPLNEIWRLEPKYLIPCVTATMPRQRFAEISRFARFDDRVARQEAQGNGIAPSKLGYISQLFEPFVKNMPIHFRPYDHIVVDEMLVKYKGNVRFRVYMKSKPGKYGMKVWAACDAATGYVLRLAIYEGKVGEEVERELGKKVVLGLVHNYFNSGRVVTTDNFFTSKALGLELMKNNMGMLGTLNKNRMDVIPEFAEGKGREIQSSIFAFQKDFTMVSYVQRKNKSVVLLSTEHHSAEINTEVKNKPQMILDYNATKGGVDTADQMISNFTCQRATRRWPAKLFHAMIDIGALNAYIIWKMHRGEERKSREDRRYFLRSLAEGLMEPIIAERCQRASALSLPTAIKNAMGLMGYQVTPPPSETRAVPSEMSKFGKCVICKMSSRSRCMLCRRFVCPRHAVKTYHCHNCQEPVTEISVEEVRKRVIYPTNLFGIQCIPDL